MKNITSKTRKIIWALSGGSCAICKQELTKKIDEKHLVLGQECHIRSPKTNGPRYNLKYPHEKLNIPDNLILLCRNHHKEIDDFINKYTADILEKIKADHEALIKNRTSQELPPIKIIRTSKFLDAILITSGMQLINMASNASGYSYSFDETEDDETYELIKNFLSYLEDLDVISDISAYNKLDVARELKSMIQDLKKHGYFIFGAVANDKITGGANGEAPWTTSYFTLTTNKKIKHILR